MIFSTLAYNLLMAAALAASLFALSRLKTAWAWMKACADVLLAAVALAFLVGAAAGESSFGVFRLLAYGFFLHGLLLLSGSAVLLRSARPKTAVLSAALTVLGVAIVVDAFWIEPTWLEVKHVEIASPKITRPMRIVVLADLQAEEIGRYEREVLQRLLAEKPDLILLAGDYLQPEASKFPEMCRELNALLRQIDFSAPAGVFAVEGNADPEGWEAMFAGLPITVVRSRQSFDLGQLRLTCLAKRDSFHPRLEIPDRGQGGEGDHQQFRIVLGHSPNFALGSVAADLLIAGHTHGGQVRIPFLGPPVTQSVLPGRFASGLLDLPGGRRLYVSRGIGMERNAAPRMRFCCRPELTVIELVPR